MAVAIVAGGAVGRDIGFAQGHGFAVVGTAIMLQPVLVAFPTGLVAGHLEMAVLGGLDFVGGVAIGTDRSPFVALGQELAVDALVIDFLDADVAFAASAGDLEIGRA